MIARKYIFVGRVQGVGFRYTSQRIAGGLALCGYVRNLPDGSVELFAQGPQADLDRCLLEIEETFAGYIREVRTKDLPVDTRHSDFGITY